MPSNKPLRHPFEERIRQIRQRVRPEPFNWYVFDTFANVTALETLLPKGFSSVLSLAGDEPIADFGTGDGDMAFLLESLGCNVTAFDWPGTNANQMLGVALLRQELSSSVSIRPIEIDQQFQLDGDRFGLALALGLLYHLKNPWYFVEKIGIHARFAVFSTRILPRGQTNECMAYLCAEQEFHNDPTNFWFFSEAGILRLLDRCGWDVTATKIIGDGKDDRFFCLAASRTAKSKPIIRILDGWHWMEKRAWRWSGRDFGVVVENLAGANRFEFRFLVEPPLLEVNSPLNVNCSVNGVDLGSESISGPGLHIYSRAISPTLARCEIRISLSHTFSDGERDLGVVVRLPASTIIDEDCGFQLYS